MDSFSYIQQLKKEYPIEGIGSNPDLAERLIDHLGDRLPDIIKYKISQGTINVTEIRKTDPQAYVKEISENDYAVVIHSGLSEFIYRVIRVISTRIIDNNLKVEAGTSFDDTVRIIAEIFWWFQETGQSFGPEYNIHEYQINIASLIATEVESFFLAHELGHIIFPKEDKLSYEKLIERLSLGDFNGYISNQSHPHYSEFTSDAVAAAIVLGLYTNSVDSNLVVNQLRYAGIEFGLLIFSNLEKLEFPISDTHPSFRARIYNIREIVKKWTNDDEQWKNLIQLATSFELMFDHIIETIYNPSKSQITFYEESAIEVLERLEKSLNKYTISLEINKPKQDFVKVKLDNGEVVDMPIPSFDNKSNKVIADYGLFYLEATNILGQGYSHIFFEKLAKEFRKNIKLSYRDLVEIEFRLNLLDFDQALKILNENEFLFYQLKEFQKSKLLIGFFSRQANPSGEYFFKKIFGN